MLQTLSSGMYLSPGVRTVLGRTWCHRKGRSAYPTANMNFKNRMGVGGQIYHASAPPPQQELYGESLPTRVGTMKLKEGSLPRPDIDTDIIIAGGTSGQRTADMQNHVLEDLDPDLAPRQDGDLIVAVKNIGCGSSGSRPGCPADAVVRCVVAPSFARIFTEREKYRIPR